jgi:hypothetical protein
LAVYFILQFAQVSPLWMKRDIYAAAFGHLRCTSTAGSPAPVN